MCVGAMCCGCKCVRGCKVCVCVCVGVVCSDCCVACCWSFVVADAAAD